jgi:hypothetical protein
MIGLSKAWSRLDWNDPLVLAALGVIAVVALFRGWSFVLLAVLIVALGLGLEYLLGHAALGADLTRGIVIGVYAFGGLLFLFLAIAHFFTKR